MYIPTWMLIVMGLIALHAFILKDIHLTLFLVLVFSPLLLVMFALPHIVVFTVAVASHLTVQHVFGIAFLAAFCYFAIKPVAAWINGK